MGKGEKETSGHRRGDVRMLAKAYARAGRRQHRFLIMAAAVGIVVLSSVCSIVYGKVEAEYLLSARQSGTAASTYLERGTQEQYDRLQTLSYIQAVGKEFKIGAAYSRPEGAGEMPGRKRDTGNAGSPENDGQMSDVEKAEGQTADGQDLAADGGEEACCEIKALDESGWTDLTVPAYTGVTGHYPTETDEIMLSVRALKKLGITNPQVGMKIPLEIEYRLLQSRQEEFTLSGYFTEYLSETATRPPGYISRAMTEELGYDWEQPDELLILQKNGINGDQVEERLYEDIKTSDSAQRFFGGNTFIYDAVEKFSGGYQVAAICGALILAGVFLLIQNVMNSAMQRDIRQYGMLQTLGATVKQEKRIYYLQIGMVSGKAVLLGGIISAGMMLVVLPGILGRLYLELFGGAEEFTLFHPMIFAGSILLVMVDLWAAAGWTMYKTAVLSPLEAMHYTGEAGRSGTRRKKVVKKKHRGSGIAYMAWKNLWRYRSRFLLTLFSLFLGISTALGTIMIGKGMDRKNEIEAKPDYVVESSVSAANFISEVEWWYNYNDEFSPISDVLRERILEIPGIKSESLDMTEGGYIEVRDRGTGLYPWASGRFDEKSYEEYKEYGCFAGAAVVQIADTSYLEKLESYFMQKNLQADMEGFREGRSVFILHDHQLSPSRQAMAEETKGMELEFVPLNPVAWTKEQYEKTKDMTFAESWNWAFEHAGESEQRERERWENAVKLEIAGYLDTGQKDFPELPTEGSYQEEGTLYLLISGKGFEKLGTARKTLRMQFDVEKEREPLVKQTLQELIQEENRGIPFDGEEKGVFLTAKSTLLSEAENYIRTNRMIMAALGIMLIWMGIMNYYHVMAAGIAARQREFLILESIGMTRRQLRSMLLLEGAYTILLTGGLVFTLGTGAIRLTAVYLKSRISYFRFSLPVVEGCIIFLLLSVICLAVPVRLFKSCGSLRECLKIRS